MAIPGWAKEMMTSFRPATDGDDPDDVMVFSQNQTEAQLMQQIQQDKIRAVRAIAAKIHDKENAIKTSKGELKQKLKEQLAELERKQFELLRDEILSACKDSAGLLDMEKLRKVKGSREFVAKIEGKNKPKLNEGRNK